MARPSARRIAKWAAIVLSVLAAVVGAWSLFWLFYNPKVSLLEPVVIQRSRQGGEITIVLGGDTGPTAFAMPAIRAHGYRYPYLPTAELLRSADVAFVNLEAPVTDSRRAAWQPKPYSYRVEPIATETWQWLGLDVISLANNHTMDYRARGIIDTVRHLDVAALAHVGGGATESDARRPVIVDVDGTRIGFLAYLEHKVLYNLWLRMYAIGARAGSAQLNRPDVAEDVRRLRPLVDVLIVSAHWGDNYAAVSTTQESYGRWMLRLGVDVVVGHHPHDVQPVEVRGRGVILYSLGNYAWGAMGYPRLRIGMLARLFVRPRAGELPGAVTRLELLPLATQNRMTNFQPRRITTEEIDWARPMIEGSRRYGSQLTVNGNQIEVTLR